MSKDDVDTRPEDWRLYKQPITSAIPYFYRWKINQIKLMLADLDVLITKYNIPMAKELKVQVEKEAERLCNQQTESIIYKRKLREKYETKKKTVQAEKRPT